MPLTFDSIAFKLAIGNRRGYLAYFLSATLSVWIFFVLSMLYSNPVVLQSASFSIFSLYAPTIVTFLFTLFMSMYLSNSLLRVRGREIGTYALLGMTRTQIVIAVMVQQVLVLSLAIGVGIVLGNLTILVIPGFMRGWFGLSMPPIRMKLVVFGNTLSMFGIASVIGLVTTIVRIFTAPIIDLMKVSRTVKGSWFETPIVGFGGLFLLILGVVIQKNLEGSLVISSLLFVLGLFLLSMNLPHGIPKILLMVTRKQFFRTVTIARLRIALQTSRFVSFAVCILAAIAVFFISVGVLILSDTERVAVEDCPFHLAFVEMEGEYVGSFDSLEKLGNSGNSELASFYKVPFVISDSRVVVSEADVSGLLETPYKIGPNQFVWVSQHSPRSDYERTYTISDSLSLQGNVYWKTELIDTVLLNNISKFNQTSPGIIVVNDADFENLAEGLSGRNNRGLIWLLNFVNWRLSEDAFNSISAEIFNMYEFDSESVSSSELEEIHRFHEPSSRLKFLNSQRSRMGLTLFLFGFIGVLFYIAIPAVLHFRFLMEFDSTVVLFRKLRWIGVGQDELDKLIRSEIGILFMVPAGIGSLCAILFSWMLPVSIGDTGTAILGTSIICLFFLCLQTLLTVVYSSLLSNRLIRESFFAGRRRI